MTIIGFIFGSIVGIFAAITGMVLFGLPMLSAALLYLIIGVGFGLTAALTGLARDAIARADASGNPVQA